MVRKRILASLLTVGMITVSALSGCGSSDDSGSSESKDGKTLVRFMVGGSAGELAQYQKAVDAFNEQSDNTQVKLIGVPGDNYNEKVLTQLKSKEAPDCFYSEEASYGELNNSDVLLDLTEYLDDSASLLKKSDVPENLLESYTFNDKITGVPVDCNPMVIYYNAGLLKELKIKTPQEYYEEGKWNFEALQEVSEKLRDASKVGFVYENYWCPLYSMMFSSDKDIYSDDMKSSGFDSDRAKSGLEYLENNIK